MKEIYDTYLKDEYRNWLEATTYLQLEGISRNKKSPLFVNIEENYQQIKSDYWGVHYGFLYKKLKANFAMRPSQSFLKTISCNL